MPTDNQFLRTLLAVARTGDPNAQPAQNMETNTVLRELLTLFREAAAGGGIDLSGRATFVQNRFSITTLVGGVGCLDGISPTNGAQAGWVVEINNAQSKWVLVAGTHAQDAAGGFVRVYDYNASTNAFYWQEIG